MKKIAVILISLFLASCNNSPKKVDSATTELTIVGSWVQAIPGMEDQTQGVKLEKDGQASSINMETLKYESWSQLGNDSLILRGKSIGNGVTSDFADTAKIQQLDSLNLILNTNNNLSQFTRLK